MKLEVTGFDPLIKNSRNENAKYHMRLRYVLYKVSASGSAIPKPEQDSIEIVSTLPQTPAVLSLGEKFVVKVRYNLTSVDQAHIWARPYTVGERTSTYKAHPSPLYDAGSGVMEGWFYFDQPTRVDEVHVQMVPAEFRESIATASLAVGAEWKRVQEPTIRHSNVNTRPSGSK